MSHEDAVFHARNSLPRPGDGAALAIWLGSRSAAPDCGAHGSTTETLGDARVRRILERELAPLPSPRRCVWPSRQAVTTTTTDARMERELPEFKRGHSRAEYYPRRRRADAAA